MTTKDKVQTFHGNPCKKGGHTLRYLKSKVCVQCEKDRNRERRADPVYAAQSKKYREDNKEALKDYMDNWRYGVSSKDIIEKQNGKCAICEDTLDLGKKTHIDHNKVTGKVRGVLCHYCNVGIGHMKHDIKIMKKAIVYLEWNDC